MKKVRKPEKFFFVYVPVKGTLAKHVLRLCQKRGVKLIPWFQYVESLKDRFETKEEWKEATKLMRKKKKGWAVPFGIVEEARKLAKEETERKREQRRQDLRGFEKGLRKILSKHLMSNNFDFYAFREDVIQFLRADGAFGKVARRVVEEEIEKFLPEGFEDLKGPFIHNVMLGIWRNDRTNGIEFIETKDLALLVQVVVSYARHRYTFWDEMVWHAKRNRILVRNEWGEVERVVEEEPLTIEDKIEVSTEGLENLRKEEPKTFEAFMKLAKKVGIENLKKNPSIDRWTWEAVNNVLRQSQNKILKEKTWQQEATTD